MKAREIIFECEAFCRYLIKENRYFLIPKWKTFVEDIINRAAHRRIVHKKGTKFWRARVDAGNRINGQLTPLDDDSMGAPPHKKASEGRVNPKGIPYLYLACDEETAIWEAKPYLRMPVTVATFELVKDVTLVNALMRDFHIGIFSKEEISLADREEIFWAYISSYFSIPIAPEDNYCDYVPAQFLSELFKNNGYDGMQYRSSLKYNGCNVVLFDTRAAVIKSKYVCMINKILYDWKKI